MSYQQAFAQGNGYDEMDQRAELVYVTGLMHLYNNLRSVIVVVFFIEWNVSARFL